MKAERVVWRPYPVERSARLEEFLSECEGRIGMDLGSRSIKAAGLVDGEHVLWITDTETMICSGTPPLTDGFRCVTTGYGRGMIKGATSINEIRAHVVGVLSSLDIDTFTLIDIGGQDFKVIRVKDRGIVDFSMNDKCAAGTGRFLEKMAGMLGMTVMELGSHKGRRKVLESTCSVFTETELISLMVEGVSREELASGVIYSVFERLRPHLRAYPDDAIVLTGGASLLPGISGTISEHSNAEVMVPKDSRFMGALGCYHADLDRVRVPLKRAALSNLSRRQVLSGP
ncbi:MAG: acyl-CoA dehydratase activase [Candidatus Thermoplasmatota archaeon]|nr:acyl-CoA dehydratase activase [Candidatus Thermoplasmatota archaeon]